MKVLIAGATGAIGRPLIHLLKAKKYTLFGITQSKERAATLAAENVKPIILNVLDRDAVFTAVQQTAPDVVIDMLTSLPKEYTSQAMQNAAERDAMIRRVGGANLQQAVEKYGAKRFIAQSSGFWYEPGVGLADEQTPLAFHASPGVAAGVRLYDEIEKRVVNSSLEGIALRFGFFYGPGTWFYPSGNMADQVRRQEFPIIGKGEGIWNFIHIEDAAQAIVDSLTCTPGIYNIVNDTPSKLEEWLPAFAHYVGAPPPLSISEEQGKQERGLDAVYYATKLRGASNQKAKLEWRFHPRPFEWLLR